MNAPLRTPLKFDITALVRTIADNATHDAFKPQLSATQWDVLASYMQPFALAQSQVLIEQGSADRTVYVVVIYLMVDPLYNNRNSIHDTAGHIIIDWLYQLAAKSEYDLELVTSYLAKSRDSLLPKYPNSVSTFNWMINYMTEKHRDSDKTIRSLKEIKQITAQLNDYCK